MFPRGNKQRASQHDASRGRGRGPTRGASNNSSGKPLSTIFFADEWDPSGSKPFRDSTNLPFKRDRERYDQGGHDLKPQPVKRAKYAHQRHNNSSSIADVSSHAFEQERLENAAKREQRGQHASANSRRGGHSLKSRIPFEKQANGDRRPSEESPPLTSNPFATVRSRTSSPFESPAPTSINPTSINPTSTNPFASKPKPIASSNPFGTSNSAAPMSNPFGQPIQPASASVFGQPSSNPTSSVFGAPSKPQTSNPFGDPPISNGTKPSASNPFASTSKFGNATFGGPSNTQASGSFNGTSAASTTSFGGASKGVFSKPTTSTTALAMSTKFGAPSQSSFSSVTSNATSTFGAPSKPLFSPSSGNATTTTFGAPTTSAPLLFPTSSISSNDFGAPKSTPFSGFSTSSTSGKPTTFGTPSSSVFTSKKFGSSSPSVTNGRSSKAAVQPQEKQPAIQKGSDSSKNFWALKLANQLKKEGIIRPTYPGQNPGDPKEGAKVESFFRGPLKTYRTKVRNSFMRAGLMDDPDKPKKLSEAIDFKGTCEDMCPFKEKFERIMEGPSAVNVLEKERDSTGILLPSLDKMVKKHSRSAAGDEEPLPEDVRSPAALRRCVDYLMTTILGSDEDLRKVHGFLWDRTRAIRRDFIFQAALSSSEMMDLIYCLEHITRFHVVALHQMSKSGTASSDFNEQQEHEQLSKSMISLMHAYGDCAERGIECENEIEFRAYHLVFNAHNSTILETVADLDRKFGEDSEQIIAAVNLVECMQTCWEKKGPLKAFRPTELPHNAFHKFFCEVKSEQTWYVLACFAEVHFNAVRKAALKTILKAYRKQRDQTTDWTLESLQTILNFDSLDDVLTFGEAHGLCFEDANGQTHLSFDSTQRIIEPFPRPKQIHSWTYVEVKRGPLTLTEVIDGKVHKNNEKLSELEEALNEEAEGDEVNALDGGDSGTDMNEVQGEEEDEGLFVKDDSASINTQPALKSRSAPIFGAIEKKVEPQPTLNFGSQLIPQPNVSKNTSVFDQVKTVQSFGTDFFTQGMTPKTGILSAKPSTFAQPANPASPTMFPQISATPTPTPTSSFSQPPFTKTAEASEKPPLSFGNYAVTQAPVVNSNSTLNGVKAANTAPAVDSAAVNFGGYKVTKASTPIVETPTSSGMPKTSTAQLPLPSPFLGAQPVQTSLPPPNFNSTATPSIAPQAPNSNPIPTATASVVEPPTQSVVPSTKSGTSFGPLGSQPLNLAAPFTAPSAASFSFPGATTHSSVGAFSQPSVSVIPQITASSKREKFVDNVTTWFATADDGILSHFTAYMVEGLLQDVFQSFVVEENARRTQEEFAHANRMADEHRCRVVAIKFLERWRHNAHIKWVRRRAVESRQLRKEMFEASLAKKAAEAANLVEDFRASTQSTRGREQVLREHTRSTSATTGVSNGVRDQSSKFRNTMDPPKSRQRAEQRVENKNSVNRVHAKQLANGSQSVNKRRRESEVAEPSSPSSKHKKSTVDNPLRRSLLDHPSYLNGESRIFYKKTWTLEDEKREHPSGTQTDYFRLKARGIHTMPDGSPLASSAATLLHRKRSREDYSKPDPRRHSTNSYGRSVSSRDYAESAPPIASAGPLVDVAAWNQSARASVDENATSRKRRSADLDDEEDDDLSTRVKRLKEQVNGTIVSVELDNNVDEDRTLKKRRSVELGEEDSRTSKKRRSVELTFSDKELEILARARRATEQMHEGQLWYQEELERDSQERESRASRRRSRASFGNQ